MTPADAWLYAASWGSFVRSGDPGACMYGFSADYRPQSERHRDDVLRHIGHCRQIVRDAPEHYDEDELDRLDELEQLTRVQPVSPGYDTR